MFHAAGWTYPWATVFAFATQVGTPWVIQRTLFNNRRSLLVQDNAQDSRLLPYLESFPPLWSHALLWCTDSSGTRFDWIS